MAKMKARKLRAMTRQRDRLVKIFSGITSATFNPSTNHNMPKVTLDGAILSAIDITGFDSNVTVTITIVHPRHRGSLPPDTIPCVGYLLGNIDERVRYLEEKIFPKSPTLTDDTKELMRTRARQWVDGWWLNKPTGKLVLPIENIKTSWATL